MPSIRPSARTCLLASWIVASCGSTSGEPAATPVRVAAAADLTAAFGELGPLFERASGRRVTFTFGSSGLLARQLREGAPFDAFAAANHAFVDDVVRAGACLGATKVRYARGRIVVWSRRSSTAARPRTLAELTDARFRRIAIANPEHAPYGVAAKQALEAAGVWDTVRPRLVFGENVRQTLQFAETGNVEVAIVALSIAIPARDGDWFVVDEGLHRPLDQALVVCRRGAAVEGGRAFARFVAAPAGRNVMRRFGFVLPGETIVGFHDRAVRP
ncbi:MAG: molybdate ABC transporter substrate-binding protein [Deltaproteobacteria bacterium]|nr:molybdate ABC transporter substrate-binding protein [Deltaproteobacteria bacterium]